jgi:hypothetical protein
MPKVPVDYSRTIIYKIYCLDPNITDIYIGYSTNLDKRTSYHASACKKKDNKKDDLYVHNFIRDNGGWVNWHLEMIEKYPCIYKNDVQFRVNYWIETSNATLNIKSPINKSDHLLNSLLEYRCKYGLQIPPDPEQRWIRIKCECGGFYTQKTKGKHLHSSKHIRYFMD